MATTQRMTDFIQEMRYLSTCAGYRPRCKISVSVHICSYVCDSEQLTHGMVEKSLAFKGTQQWKSTRSLLKSAEARGLTASNCFTQGVASSR
eukprot:TRINITY_DN75788_c0_g1_i1.p1 TRINITY_DN75788_c0_g1~~TRINITY_DN75788_c0_g1_i1.p1  ORF type:complete len:105 (-),score=9.85 TRINITY_DN75788_c0_g1_i1:276-551(-)